MNSSIVLISIEDKSMCGVLTAVRLRSPHLRQSLNKTSLQITQATHGMDSKALIICPNVGRDDGFLCMHDCINEAKDSGHLHTYQ